MPIPEQINAMERVPPELFSEIIRNLGIPLAPYSTISRKWQHSIEALTMTKIHAGSDRIGDLDALLQDPRRRAHLKSLKYEIILPPYSTERWYKLPSQRECRENNLIFTRELRTLFVTLQKYGREKDSMSLRLAVCCPMDSYEPSSEERAEFWKEGTGQERNYNTLIHLDYENRELLPILNGVIQFGGYQPCERRSLHPSVLETIMLALPSVEKIKWTLLSPEVRLVDLRRGVRTSLVHALQSPAFSSLRNFTLRWDDADCSNHSFHARNLTDPNTGLDTLSVALRRIAKLPTIKRFKLLGSLIVSSTFFELTTSDNDTSPLLWSSLKILELNVSSMTPDGDWYFTGDPKLTEPSEYRSYTTDNEEDHINSSDSGDGERSAVRDWAILNGDEPYHPWRVLPNPKIFDIFLLKLTEAVIHMPALRRLHCQIGSRGNSNTSIYFRAAREKPSRFSCPDSEVYDWPHWDIELESDSNDYEKNQEIIWEIPKTLQQAWKNTTGSQSNSVHLTLNGQLTVL